jgi:hypothetical protein
VVLPPWSGPQHATYLAPEPHGQSVAIACEYRAPAATRSAGAEVPVPSARPRELTRPATGGAAIGRLPQHQRTIPLSTGAPPDPGDPFGDDEIVTVDPV